MNPTYTVNGSTYEPLSDYLRGWIPGALGLPCPPDPSPETMDAWNQGVKDRLLRGPCVNQITNILWHECRRGNCRKIAQ